MEAQNGKLGAALTMAERAVSLSGGEERLIALTNHGQMLALSGNYLAAVANFSAVLAAGAIRCPATHAALHNLAVSLADAGPVGAAQALDFVRIARRCIQGQTHRSLMRAKILWVEARAWATMERPRRAGQKLRRAIARMIELQAPVDAALAALDHAEITGRLLAPTLAQIEAELPADAGHAAIKTIRAMLEQARAGAKLATLAAEYRGALARLARRRIA